MHTSSSSCSFAFTFLLVAHVAAPCAAQVGATSIAQRAYLKASNTAALDRFGSSIAISGNTLVVGAPSEASDATGVGGNQASNATPYSGAACVFVRAGSSWSQQAYLKASNTGLADVFGSSVAISGDTLVVGAPGEFSNATGVDGNQADNSLQYAGAAYVFVRSGSTWTQQAYLKPASTSASDGFGISVAISGDVIVVGSLNEDGDATGVNGGINENADGAGAAYVFVRNGMTWSLQDYVKASNTGAQDGFGAAVSLWGDTLVVGAPGESSAATGVGGDGLSDAAPHSGAAYVFVRSGSTWTQQAYVKASNTGAGDVFGTTLAISGDVLVIGATAEDSAATGGGGDGTNDGAEGAGAAYVFARNGSTWSQQAYLKASNAESFDLFGSAVAAADDTVVVTAQFESSTATGLAGDQSNDDAPGAGAAYLFARNGTTWSQRTYLKASNTGTSDQFGSAVSMSAATLVIGAPSESSDATGVGGDPLNDLAPESGAAYVFLVGVEPVAYCFGDGSGAACPCSPAPVLHGAPGKGCPSNVFAGGARAAASGIASLSEDSLALAATDVVNGSMLFYQGGVQQSGGMGAAFGDGLRCIQPSGIRRLPVLAVAANSAAYPRAGDPPISAAGLVLAPGVRNYQGWYRSANPSFCTPATFNFTNGVRVTWVP